MCIYMCVQKIIYLELVSLIRLFSCRATEIYFET